jgi:hypothetical protein
MDFEQRYSELLKYTDLIWFKCGNGANGVSKEMMVRANGREYNSLALLQAIKEGDMGFMSIIVSSLDHVPIYLIRQAAENDQLDLLKMLFLRFEANKERVTGLEIYYTIMGMFGRKGTNLHHICILLLDHFDYCFIEKNYGYGLSKIEDITLEAINNGAIAFAAYAYNKFSKELFSPDRVFNALINNNCKIDVIKTFFCIKFTYRHQIWNFVKRDDLELFKYFVGIYKHEDDWVVRNRIPFIMKRDSTVSYELACVVATFMYEIKNSKANDIMKYLLEFHGIRDLFLKDGLIMYNRETVKPAIITGSIRSFKGSDFYELKHLIRSFIIFRDYKHNTNLFNPISI